MAKTMARVENGVVVNIEWRSNSTEETASLVEIDDRNVGIGDTYDGANFYHNGEKIMTQLEAAQAEAEKLKEENTMLTAQVSALSDQMDFYEECIVEMAEVVYA